MTAASASVRAVDLLRRLVSFNTESKRSNRALINFVADYLNGHGVAVLRAPNAAGDKEALYCTIGPQDRGGVLLSGHTDVVPVAGQVWTSDPYELRIADGRAYGRGAVDMKSFAALALAAIPDWLEAGLKTPIHLLLSYDEETTCFGSLDVIRRFGADLPKPVAAIVGEPTEMQVADAHKSVMTFNTTVHGFEHHSSKPERGANAVHGAALLIAELIRIADDMKALGDPSGRFDPPYTSVHVGMITGGAARNITPRQCLFEWEYRGVPGRDLESLIVGRLDDYARAVVEPMLKTGHSGARVETVSHARVPALAPEPGSAAEHLAQALAGRNNVITVPFGTEAGHFQAAGIPTVVCGPGSIDQAHQPDEYISLEALARGGDFMRRLGATLSA
ncbi:MAG: acetylornithine deacetylase (ArgE) [Rhizobiales bacterium 65-9]|nr:acetylornithine deacetylase [Hyphomicrobiales bacterium]OJY38143.1 MAG: acetylornithine deacetylase (ArgE) [Rhizobiales bacterium 65-9]